MEESKNKTEALPKSWVYHFHFQTLNN